MPISDVTSTDRLMSLLSSALDEDVLLVSGVVGNERMSGLFGYELDLLADVQKKKHLQVKPEELVGSNMTVVLRLENGERYLNGIVKKFQRGHADKRFLSCTAELVPWTWLLTLTSDCRVFQNSTIPEIVEVVFNDLKHQYPDVVKFRNELQSSDYRKLDCCIQYRETDFNFVSRLMEADGIGYYFEHESGSHTLVMVDGSKPLKKCPERDKYEFVEHDDNFDRVDVVFGLDSASELRAGKFTMGDYDFQQPKLEMKVEAKTRVKYTGGNDFELFDYPGEFTERFNKPSERLDEVKDEGRSLADVRMQEEEVRNLTVSGTSNIRAFIPGHLFTLTKHPESALNIEYCLLSTHFSIQQTPSYISGAPVEDPYSNGFTCIPKSTPYAPARVTPKPVVQGPQTAVVTVKNNEESWLDKYGRVRIKFHWDRLSKDDENCTCWVRVAQPWAGARWGAHFWPRIGQEVVVEFLEGDPDKPLITGSVYNAANMPPYDLPKNYTRSGVITRSSKTGGSANFNEIRFEDKKGAEQLFLHAEMDMDQSVEHDSRESIGHDFHLDIGHDQTENVGGEKHTTVGGDVFEDYGKNVHTNIATNEVRNVGSSVDSAIGGNQTESVGGNLHTNVGMNVAVEAGVNFSLKVGANFDQTAGANYAVAAGAAIHIKAGAMMVLEAASGLCVKCGSSYITLTPAAMFISAPMVMINSGGASLPGLGAHPQSPQKPGKPTKPNPPDKADDGSKGTKLNS